MSYKCVCGASSYAKRQRICREITYTRDHTPYNAREIPGVYAESTRFYCPSCGRDVTPRVLADKGKRPPLRKRKTTQLADSMDKAVDENFQGGRHI